MCETTGRDAVGYLGQKKQYNKNKAFVSFLTLKIFFTKVINKYFEYFCASLTKKTQTNINKDECFSISVLLVLLPQCMACQKPTAAIVKNK